ncbi:DDE-1 domain containing protein [Pyrenophora tritici-repentis]|nr:DDE-1 domain containing protein [Pyrenophora tritici-repentis]
MEPASQVLAQADPIDVPADWASLVETEEEIPYHTRYYRKRGRPSMKEKAQGQQYLTPPEEKALVAFILRMGAVGTPIRVKYIPALAFCIASRRATNRPSEPPKKNWPQAFRRRHPQLKSRNNRPMPWERHDNSIYDKVVHWFDVIKEELCRSDVLPENAYNMDETGIMLSMLGSVKVLVGKDDRRDYRGTGTKRTMVTAIECVSASGEYLNPMIIWPASTHRSNWTTYPTPGWFYALSETGYNDSFISLEWIKEVFDPQTKARANGKPRILICDGFGTHETLEVLEFCFENNIILCRLPSHTSHKTQPCDVSVFGPLKTAYRDEVERRYRGGLTNVNKEHFTAIYSCAREVGMTKKNILAGWAKTGLFPFNPSRVLRDIVKPGAPLTIQLPCEVESTQNRVIQTPVTPVSSEAVTQLLSLIKQESHNNEPNELRSHRLVQKLANAAERSIARQALDQNYIGLLKAANNEAKTRRNTRSEILKKPGKNGEGRVMKQEDLEAIRAERAERAKRDDAKKAAGKAKRGRPKGTTLANEGESGEKRGRKRKTVAPEDLLDEQEADALGVLAKAARTSEALIDPMLETWRAPVAKMW